MTTTELDSEGQPAALQAQRRRKRIVRRIRQAFREEPRWWCGVILLLFVVAAIAAPLLTPYSPVLYHPADANQAPSLAHLLGTDDLGRDQLSRVIYGTRISLTIGLVTILLGGIVGTVLGVIGAYNKGWVDQLITIIVDALLSFPSLIFVLALVAALGPGLINVAIALAVVRIPIYARLARGQTLQVASLDYVTAAVVCGTRTSRILLRHILPNIFSPLLVQATVSISVAILDESVLSFLGLGAQPPTPEWGAMISEAQQFLRTDPWMMAGPALAVVIVLLSLNILGDAVRDYLDPRDRAAVNKPL